jgi:hypothetical protein
MITRRSLFGMTFGGAVAAKLPVIPATEPIASLEPTKATVPAPPPMRITIGAHGHACKVEIAGVDVSHLCCSARIQADANDITRVQLDMLVREGSEIVAEAGALDLTVHNLPRRLRFEADDVRVKADL